MNTDRRRSPLAERRFVSWHLALFAVGGACSGDDAWTVGAAATFDAPGSTDADPTRASDSSEGASPSSSSSSSSEDESGAGDAPDDPSDEPPDEPPDEPLPFPIEGFGADTKGGWQPGHTIYHVTSLADQGPGTIREGVETDGVPRIVVFDVDGEIPLSSPLLLPSNITIDGRGHAVTLTGKGLILPGSDEVIVTNIAIASVGPDTEDGLMIGSPTNGPSENVVIDHVRFEQFDDGGDSDNVDEAISVIFGSRNITIAWCAFLRWEKVILIGNGDAPEAVDRAVRVTFHHNWAHATGRRHPKARYGLFDFYNNFLDDWRMYDWQYLTDKRSFGAEVTDDARLLFEKNIVRRDEHTYDVLSEANEVTLCDADDAFIDERDTWVTPDSTAELEFQVDCPEVYAPLVRPYAATVDAADATLRARLETQTGNVQ